MKKKVFIIVGIIVAFLVTTGLVTSYIDSARVRNSVEPKFVIKIVTNGGNKVTYWGLGYKVVRYTKVSPSEPYKNNRGVKYGSWFMKYELEEDKEYAKHLTKEDIMGESGFLFSISWGDNKTDCIPVKLDVFDDGRYTLHTSYEDCPPNASCVAMLVYSEYETGTYDYDVIKIIQNSVIADDMSFTNDDLPEYEIYPGNQEKVYHLITDSKNSYLDEFLKQIDVNLKKCAKSDYK